jgi:hypothetical protein
MPIVELETPETVDDEFGRPLTLTHVFHGCHVEPTEAAAYSVRGVLVDGVFAPYERSRKHEMITGEDFERLLASHPAGNDFRVSDARQIRQEIEARKAQQQAEEAALLASLAATQRKRNR